MVEVRCLDSYLMVMGQDTVQPLSLKLAVRHTVTNVSITFSDVNKFVDVFAFDTFIVISFHLYVAYPGLLYISFLQSLLQILRTHLLVVIYPYFL